MVKRITRRELLRGLGLAAAGAVAASCQPKVVEVTRVVEKEVEKEVTKVVQQVVKETVVVEGTAKVVEKEVTRVIEKVATPVPEEITLSVPNIWGGSRVPLMDDMFRRFSEVHPGLTVENVLVPGAEMLQKLQTGIAAGTPSDVPMINQSYVPMLASKKSLLPLDSYMALEGIDYEEYYDYAMAASQWEGKTYTLPNCSAAYSLYFYNLTHYEEVGLDPQAPPESWEELTDYSKKLTVIKDEQIERLGYQFYNGLPGLVDFQQALIANAGEFFSDDGRQAVFNSEEGVEALKFLITAMKEIYGTVESYQDWTSVQGAQDISNPFISETCASRHGGVWEIFYILEGKPDLNYTIGLLPGGPKGEQVVPARGSWSYGIPVGVKHPDASWELVEWLSHEPTSACWFMQQQGRPSPLRACNEDKYYYDTFPTTWPMVVEMADKAVFIPLTLADAEIDSVVTQALEEAAHGVKTPEEALDWAQTESQALLDKALA